MKLKKQFDRIGGNRLNEAQIIHGVDYSTLKLKSNIDQKWQDKRDMENDLISWYQSSISAGGEELGQDLLYTMREVVFQMEKIIKKRI